VRVVSLVPSITETLLAWGVDVVACTRFCEQPDIPHVGGTKDPDVAAIVALAPDLVVVDREENRREDADALVHEGLRCHVTHVRSVTDVVPELDRLAAAVGVDGHLALSSESRRAMQTSAPALPNRRSAFVPIWRRPWMTIGADTYGSSLLAALGVDNVVADHPDRYPTIEPAAVASRRPDLVLLPSEPYPFAERHVPEITGMLPWARVVLVDGRDLFWWGVRTPGALERLRRQLVGSASP